MKSRILFYVKIFLILAIVSTLIFTFYQSAQPMEKSAEISENFGEMIEPIIPSDTPVGSYVHDNLRKIAHFFEFFALGAEVCLYVSLFLRQRNFIVASLLAAPFTALFDETIQVFSARGASVVDIWIDIGGYATAAALIYFASLIVLCVKKRKGERILKNGDIDG